MKENNIMKLSIAAAVAGTFSLSATTFAAVDIIKIDGSSTVYPISEAVAEEFQKATGIKVTVIIKIAFIKILLGTIYCNA